jgi:amidase
VNDEDLAFAGVEAQRELLQARAISAVDLVSLCLARIERLNPRLNAFTFVRGDEARREAAAAQAALVAGDERPLLGIPFAIKDDLDLAGSPTSYGTGLARKEAGEDSDMVRVLRQAGAIAVGKTTLPELGTHAFTDSVAWGVTRNPWDPSRTPGGSSGGSAVAVAAGLVPFATGGDGGGSIRIPAAWCNLFGLKVQRGTLPGGSERDLTVHGVLTRSVADAAFLYDLLSQPSGRPPLVQAARDEPRSLRVGMTFQLGLPASVDRDVRRLVTDVAHTLVELGHDVSPVKVRPGNWGVPFSVAGLRLLSEQARPIKDRRALEPSTQGALRVARLVPASLVGWANTQQDRIKAKMVEVFDGLDVVLTPTTAVPAALVQPWSGSGLVRDGLRMARQCPFTSLWNFVGLPATSVPAGFTDDGLPVGAQLLGGPDSEATLVALSAQLERALRWTDHRPPLSSGA